MEKLILVSAGHSTIPPIDSGAVGGGHQEARLALNLRDAVAKILRARSLNVIEDGSDGQSEPLKKAVILARRSDVAIEIHFNAGPPTANGVEVLAKKVDRELAQRLAKAISKAAGLKLRGSEGGYKADNSGAHHRLAFCEAGGLIVEVCFISSASDLKKYLDNFDRVAASIAEVLHNEVLSGKAQLISTIAPAISPSDSNSPKESEAVINSISEEENSIQTDNSPITGGTASSAAGSTLLPERPQIKADAENLAQPTESSQTEIAETAGGSIAQTVTKINEQDVNEPAFVEEPRPQGVAAKLKAGLGAFFGSATLYIVLEKLGALTFSQTALILICFVVFLGFVGFMFWAALQAWKSNERVKHEVGAKTAIDKRDLVWVKPQ